LTATGTLSSGLRYITSQHPASSNSTMDPRYGRQRLIWSVEMYELHFFSVSQTMLAVHSNIKKLHFIPQIQVSTVVQL
jgi:hypothetical protein